MITALLLLLVLIEASRLALQWRSGKEYDEYYKMQDKTYCTSYEVENILTVTKKSI